MARFAAAGCFAALLLMLLGHPAALVAAHSPRPIHLALEVVVNPVGGTAGTRCVLSGVAEVYRKAEWWVTYGAANLQAEEGGQGTANTLLCGSGAAHEPGSQSGGASTASPYFTAGVAAVPRPLQERGDFSLEISLEITRLSGFTAQGTGAYERESARRSLFVFGERETVIPLLAANAKEQSELGLREIVLRLRATSAPPTVTSVYGSVLVSSPLNRAEILLDGGSVGKIEPGGPTLLSVVRAGEREVGVRDNSGREIRRWVRVQEGRTVLVELSEAAATGVADYPLSHAGSNAQGYEEYRRSRDGATVVRIPGGEFLMGNKETERQPLEHRVSVGTFLIDKTEVTWAQYKAFAAATARSLPPDPPWWGIHDDHPATFVTWEEGRAYCSWAGARLPTEAEWERACRGDDARMFPWGNEEPTPERAVFRRSWGFAATDAAGAYPAGASPFGVLDMGGSLWEYVADWYGEDYYKVSPQQDPRGPSSGAGARGARRFLGQPALGAELLLPELGPPRLPRGRLRVPLRDGRPRIGGARATAYFPPAGFPWPGLAASASSRSISALKAAKGCAPLRLDTLFTVLLLGSV